MGCPGGLQGDPRQLAPYAARRSAEPHSVRRLDTTNPRIRRFLEPQHAAQVAAAVGFRPGESLDGVSELLVEGSPLPEVDHRCPILSLPLALGARLDTIPHAEGYLRSNPAIVAEWRSQIGGGSRPRIGLVWSGNPKQGNDHNRSFRLADWIGQLLREFQYVCLQKDIRPADQETLAANPWILRYDAELRDFDDTAALCECLDLVISVCTSVAHLSGALRRPTWVLLPFNPDWRWLLGRNDSPWYQSVKLYRQPAIGDWHGVFARVAADLRQRFALDKLAVERRSVRTRNG